MFDIYADFLDLDLKLVELFGYACNIMLERLSKEPAVYPSRRAPHARDY